MVSARATFHHVTHRSRSPRAHNSHTRRGAGRRALSAPAAVWKRLCECRHSPAAAQQTEISFHFVHSTLKKREKNLQRINPPLPVSVGKGYAIQAGRGAIKHPSSGPDDFTLHPQPKCTAITRRGDTQFQITHIIRVEESRAKNILLLLMTL